MTVITGNMASNVIPKLPKPTINLAQLDSKLCTLSSKKREWAKASVQDRIHVLKEIRQRINENAVEWAKATASIRKTESVGQELIGNVTITCANIDGILYSLEHLERNGHLPKPSYRINSSGQQVFKVFPKSFGDKFSPLGLAGTTVELYLKPGCKDSQGKFYQNPHEGNLAVVLGAGNQNFLAISDVLHALFVEGCVVALKPHPLQTPTARFIDYILEPLSQRGYYCSIITDDLGICKKLLYHNEVDKVHMTGGIETHDTIVWGPPDDPETEHRRKANTPILKVPITSELGCVTPWIITPGPWTDEDVKHHAQALAEGIGNNVSCNCLAAKLVLLPSTWDKTELFVEEVKRTLDDYPLPPPYYPGIQERYRRFNERYERSCLAFGRTKLIQDDPCGEPLPWLVNEIPFPSHPEDEYAFQVEPFAPVITFVKVPCNGAEQTIEEFLQASVDIANMNIWGSLSCTIIVHPQTENVHKMAVQKALDALEYGSIVVNAWSAMGYLPAEGHWGAFAGNQTLQNAGSGIGYIHNSFMFDESQKSVVKVPFYSPLQPMPPHVQPPPSLKLSTIIAGLVHGGILGALKALFTKPE